MLQLVSPPAAPAGKRLGDSCGSEPAALRRCPLCDSDNRQRPPSRYSRGDWQLKDCGRCGLLYLENPPPGEALAHEHRWSHSLRIQNQRRLESHPWSGRVRRSWKQFRRRWLPHRKMEALIRRHVPAGDLLDIGCGAGSLFEHLPPGLVPHGIEIDPEVIGVASSRAAARGGRVIQAHAVDGLATIAAGSVSGIVMHSYLEHEVLPLPVLRAARRVLRNDGLMIIKVPNFACWNRTLQGGQWPGFRFPDHVNYFTPQSLSQLVREAGLTVLRFAFRDRLPTSDNMWLLAGRCGRRRRAAG